MSNFKEFWKKHKTKVLVVGGVIVGGTVMYFIMKDPKYIAKINLLEKQMITWSANNKDNIGLERVKEFLDLNKDNPSKFAIARVDSEPSKYSIILLELKEHII